MSKTPLLIQGITAVAVVACGKLEVRPVVAEWPPDYVGELLGCAEP